MAYSYIATLQDWKTADKLHDQSQQQYKGIPLIKTVVSCTNSPKFQTTIALMKCTYTGVGNGQSHSWLISAEVVLGHSQCPQTKSTSSNNQQVDNICKHHQSQHHKYVSTPYVIFFSVCTELSTATLWRSWKQCAEFEDNCQSNGNGRDWLHITQCWSRNGWEDITHIWCICRMPGHLEIQT